MSFDAAAYLRLSANHSLGVTPSGIAFATSTGDVLELSSFGPGIFRVRAGPDTHPDYGIVVGHAKACTVAETQPGTWTLSAGDATLEITGTPLHLRLLHKGVPVLTSTTDLERDGTTRLPVVGRLRRGEQWTAAFALASGEPVYGLGEKFGPLDKRGQLAYSQVENTLGVNTGLASKNVPLAWSPGTGAGTRRGAWGMFVHTPGLVTHSVGFPEWSHRSYALVVDDEALDLFLVTGDTPAAVLAGYAEICGHAPAVPPWSLGLWVSRAQPGTAEEAVALAAKLRARRIPCDVLAFDGNAAWDEKTRFSFEWDPQRFPDPPAMLAQIKAHHLRVCVREHPYIAVDGALFEELAARQYLLTDAKGDPCIVSGDEPGTMEAVDAARRPLPESGIVDFTHPDAFAWWRDAHEKLFADGVDAIKCDFGDELPDDAIAFNGDDGLRLHNAYPLLYQQCVYEATAKFHADALPVLLANAGWAGSQRYPLAGSGDAQSDWEGLAAAIRGALALGMSGQPFHAGDVGGGYGQAQPPPELFVRWLQAAVFASHLRLAGPSGREPWLFGDETEAIARKWLDFRYRLIPYLQQTMAQATRDGLPVMRAMALAFPGNALLRSFETQFLCGDALLVAPILGPAGEVEIALPPGAWYDLNSRQRYAGQRVLRYRAALDQFPVFGREGHVLPLGRAVQHTGEIDSRQPLEQLWVFGRPGRPLEGFLQATVTGSADATFTIHATPGLDVQLFGDAADLQVVRRG